MTIESQEFSSGFQLKEGFFGIEEACIHSPAGCGCFGFPERISVNFVCGLCFGRFDEGHSHASSERKVIVGTYRESDKIPEFLDVSIAQMVGAFMFDHRYGN